MGLDTNIREPIRKAAETPSEAIARSEDMDLRRLVSTVWRSKWRVLLFALIGLGLAHLWLDRVVPLYQATADVLWDDEESTVVDIAPVASRMGNDYFRLQSQIEIVRSSSLLGKVVDALDLLDDPVFNPALGSEPADTASGPVARVGDWLGLASDALDTPAAGGAGAITPQRQRETAIALLRGMLESEWIQNSYVIRITVTTPDPERAAQLANTVAEFFILDQLEKKFEATRQATAWLSDRVADLRVELETAEQAVEAYSSASTLVSTEALSAKSRQVKELRERLRQTAQDLATHEASAAAVAAARSAGDRVAMAEALRNPELAQIARRIEAARTGGQDTGSAIARFDAALDGALSRFTVVGDRLTAQREVLERTIGTEEVDLDRQSTALVQLRQLEREAEASRLIYESFLSRLKETTVQQGIQQPDARLLSPAWVPDWPSSPNRPAVLGLGLLAGLSLAIGWVVLREQMNTTFRTADDLEARTGYAVLSSIPLSPIQRRSGLLKFLTGSPASGFAESVRNLRTSVLLANVDRPPQVIMTTSGLPGEGKTTCCIALAQISRSLGKRVVVIECDLRRRNFRKYFNIRSEGGLLSVLSGSRSYEDVVHVDEVTGLHVLPGEQSPVNAADVFASHRFAEFVSELREHYDFIYIDTPPVLAVPDARVIAQLADAVLYLVRWNSTLRDTVAQGLRHFQLVNVKVTGLVLSQVDIREMNRYGYTSYGYYAQAAKYYQD